MKAVKYRWNPNKMIWQAYKNDETVAVAKEICGEGPVATAAVVNTPTPIAKKSTKKYVRKTPDKDYALKVKIKDIINADKAQLEAWEKLLKDHVNEVMSEDNSGNSVSKRQESVWMNYFRLIAKNLKGLSAAKQEYELVFEYSLPSTVYERSDVFLLTNSKAVSLEFKRKETPQIDSNKGDVAQAIRYKEWLQNRHKVTKEKDIAVKSYLVCIYKKVGAGSLRGEKQCSFCDEWLASSKTEMPDMLHAIEFVS